MFTSLAANVESIATNPEDLPNNLTNPIPFKLQLASTFAALIVLTHSWMADSNPKLLSIIGISLSILLGIPTKIIFFFFSLKILANSLIPLWVPSPPIKNTILTLFFSNCFAISSPSNPLLEVPNTVPPKRWISFISSGSNFIQQSFLVKPKKPHLIPYISATP